MKTLNRTTGKRMEMNVRVRELLENSEGRA